jgi:two-component system chemotaxis response regulator CheB
MAVVAGLPDDLPATVLIVLHMPSDANSMLPTILQRHTRLRVEQGRDGAPLEPGVVYVARPDHHLLVERDRVRVIHGPRENRARPAVDPLFRSAAIAYGARVIGVVLTGSLDDGTSGLQTIKQRGGLAVVQDPEEALYESMPRSALRHVNVDYIAPLAALGPLIGRLSAEPADEEGATPVTEDQDLENRLIGFDGALVNSDSRPGAPSAFSCPECGGVLWELNDEELSRFRCRVGHAYSAETMLAGQHEALEEALWMALKTLEENALLSRRLRDRARDHGHQQLVTRYEERIQEANQHAQLLRSVLLKAPAAEPAPGRTPATT